MGEGTEGDRQRAYRIQDDRRPKMNGHDGEAVTARAGPGDRAMTRAVVGRELSAILRAAASTGVRPPFLRAKSTHCRSPKRAE